MDSTYKLAKKFYEEEWDNEDMKHHSIYVIEASVNMIKNTNLNKNIFYIAGWIHDIGRKDDVATHNELSVKYFEKFLQQYPKFDNIKYEIIDCILNHRSNLIPKTIYGKIMQIADKVALQNVKWIEYKNNSNND